MSALLRLQEQGILSAEAVQDLESRAFHAPGWLAALQGIAAWVAALMIIASAFVFFQNKVASSFGIFGGILIAGAVFLFYRKDNTFFSQLALAFSLAGQGLLTSSYSMSNHDLGHLLVGAFVAAAMTLPRSTLLHRSLCSLLALGCLSIWVFYFSNHGNYSYKLFIGTPRLEILGVLFAAMSAALWLWREKWAAHQQAPRFKALAHAGMLMNFGVMGFFCVIQSSLVKEYRGQVPGLLIYSCGAAILFLALSFYLSRKLPPPQRVPLLIVAVALAFAAHGAPWLLVCASLSLTAFYACHRAWFALSLLGAVLLLGQFYYSLELTLLAKSGVLALSGAILLALRLMLQHWHKEAT
ncbi:hypothetical protein FACS1894154_05110 [Betaproteobacteria bacterium]|nr:hypothetical protein FACS1894154_05110 [Betaproteobacteria bacterium]GHU22685.1 hypothetical protein FACS189488_03710 [Betaproteobacteria bacterium]